MVIASFAWGGCASAPEAVLDDDLEAFTKGIDAILKIDMPIKEARKALRARMPRPSMDTVLTAPVPSANRSTRMQRYMMAWPTLNTGTSMVVTIFCDRHGKVVRWTVGTLTENR